MDQLERELDRILEEAHEKFSPTVDRYYERQANRALEAEYIMKELRFAIMRDPSLLESFGVNSVRKES